MPNPVGRPTDYDPKYCTVVDTYLAGIGAGQLHLPKIVSFARYIGVAKDTLYEWAKHHPEFSDALKKIMEAQEERLQDDGIYGGKEVNATIVKLLLQNNHGMRERRDVTTDGKPIPLLSLLDVSNNDSTQEAEEANQEN